MTKKSKLGSGGSLKSNYMSTDFLALCSDPSRLIQSPCLSFLSHTANSRWLSILYMVMYISMLLFPYISLSPHHPFYSNFFIYILEVINYLGEVPGDSDSKECRWPRFDSWVRKISGEGNGNPLQYSCQGNPWTEEPGGLQSIHGVAKSWTRLSD